MKRLDNLEPCIGIVLQIAVICGYLCFTPENIIQNSSFQTAIGEIESSTIRICAINDKEVSANDLTAGGVIKGLEYGELYKITYYAGTYKNSINCYCDIGMLRSYELFCTDVPVLTDNNYLKFNIPTDLKSGYYRISNAGIFAYYDFERGEKDVAKAKMNEPYYVTEDEQMEEFSKQYVIDIPENKQNIKIEADYVLNDYSIDDVKCILTDPAGTTYNMEVGEEAASIELAEMMSGTWYVNILPKDLEVTSVAPVSTTPENETISDEKEFVFDEADSNIQFICTYEGEDNIWGTIEQESTGDVKNLVLDAKQKTLSYTYPYLAADTYTVTIYHYVDSAVDEVTYQVDATTQDIDMVLID